MPGGRPSKGTSHVMQLEGAIDDKHRLRVILDVMGGQMSVRQACEVLRISEARFHQLRGQVLQAALDGLAPKASGRPRSADPDDTPRVEQLKRQVRELEMDLQAALVRTELALAMPQVLMDRADKHAKKNSIKPPS
jgi:helix-turn-helix protein